MTNQPFPESHYNEDLSINQSINSWLSPRNFLSFLGIVQKISEMFYGLSMKLTLKNFWIGSAVYALSRLSPKIYLYFTAIWYRKLSFNRGRYVIILETHNDSTFKELLIVILRKFFYMPGFKDMLKYYRVYIWNIPEFFSLMAIIAIIVQRVNLR